MDLSMFGGSALGIIYRIIAHIVGGIREKRQKHEDACNARISGNSSGYNTNLDPETAHTANIISLMFATTFSIIMLLCAIYPQAEYKRVMFERGAGERYIDFFFFKWTWAPHMEQFTVVTSSGDFLYFGFQLIQFCVTALYKPK